MNREAKFEDLLGKVLIKVEVSREEDNDNFIHFYTDDGLIYGMYHLQDCCESVYIKTLQAVLTT